MGTCLRQTSRLKEEATPGVYSTPEANHLCPRDHHKPRSPINDSCPEKVRDICIYSVNLTY